HRQEARAICKAGDERRQCLPRAWHRDLPLWPGTFEGIHGYNESVSVKDVVAAKAYLLAIFEYFGLP
ncbi:MAG: hypothetical protein C4339_06250, partial [Nitrososphaerota archaeon]